MIKFSYPGLRGVFFADSERWITVHPNGENGKGRPALIETDTGEVLGGMGGKFNGKHISAITARGANEQAGAQAKIDRSHSIAERREAIRQRRKVNSLDLSLPDRLDPHLVLQNRSREDSQSVVQMNSISANPDYDRLGPSHLFSEGAPVVAFGTVPQEQMGRVVMTTAPNGRKIPVQYAVVEAADLVASNNSDGSKNDSYYSTDPNIIRAIAGNGRIAGLQAAYRKGTAGDYRDFMEVDDDHGINPDIIAGMTAPILVRVMQPKDVTADIGDISNQTASADLNVSTRAENDARRLDLSRIDITPDGDLTVESIREFVHQMPKAEQAGMLSASGEVTREAQNRLKAAVFIRAYNSKPLVAQYFEALNPTNKVVLTALESAAPAMAKLGEIKEDGYDIRNIVTAAANTIIEARRRKLNPLSIADTQELDLGLGPSGIEHRELQGAIGQIVRLFAENPRSPSAIANALQNIAKELQRDAETSGGNLFNLDRTPINDLISRGLSAARKSEEPPRASKPDEQPEPDSSENLFGDGELGMSIQARRAWDTVGAEWLRHFVDGETVPAATMRSRRVRFWSGGK